FGHLGCIRQQPQGEVLRDHESRKEAADRGNRKLGADCQCDRTAAAAGGRLKMRFVGVWARARALFNSRRVDIDFQGDVASNLQALSDDYIARGMTPEQARRAALVRFGGPTHVMEHNREQRSLSMIENAVRDVRYALRALHKYPAFSLVAIGTLA